MNQRCIVCDYHPSVISLALLGTTDPTLHRGFTHTSDGLVCSVCTNIIVECSPALLDDTPMSEFISDPKWDQIDEFTLPSPNRGIDSS